MPSGRAAAPVETVNNNLERPPRPRAPKPRRRSEDVYDEMRLFSTCGTREQPPTHRAAGRVNQIHKQTDSASQESNVRSSATVGRARGNSLAEEPSVSWLAIRPSAPVRL
jgi:hypothetical protein